MTLLKKIQLGMCITLIFVSMPVMSQDLNGYLGTYKKSKGNAEKNYYIIKKGTVYLSNFLYGSDTYLELKKIHKTINNVEFNYYTNELAPPLTSYYLFEDDKILISDEEGIEKGIFTQYDKQPSVKATDLSSTVIGEYWLQTNEPYLPGPMKIFVRDNKVYLMTQHEKEGDLILSNGDCDLKYKVYTEENRCDCLDIYVSGNGEVYILYQAWCKCKEYAPSKWIKQ